MKTIGLIGGLGWESTAIYYRVMNLEVRKQLGAWHSARLIVDSLDFQPFATANRKEDFAKLQSSLVDSAQRLERAGADLLVIACNTVHRFATTVQNSIAIPLLHIADPAGEALRRDGHQKVGLLGTRATTEGSFYRQRLAELFNIEVIVPTREERSKLHQLIVEELNGSRVSSDCAAKIDLLIEDFANQGASAVILACTELGLAFENRDSAIIARALPAYDTAILHALGAVKISRET